MTTADQSFSERSEEAGGTGFSAAARDPGLWDRLREASDQRSFAAAWLDLQCRMIPGVAQGVVVLGKPDGGSFAPVATWPEKIIAGSLLTTAVETAIAGRRASVQRHNAAETASRRRRNAVAQPVLVDGEICGAVGLDIDAEAGADLDVVLRQLEWGVRGLEAAVGQRTFSTKDRLVSVLDLLATSLHDDRFQAAATAVATELAALFRCERVSIGFLRGRHVQVRALSHSASFAEKSNLVRGIEAAMDEAIDQQATVLFPPLEGRPPQVTRSHQACSAAHGGAALCTIPMALPDGGRLLGAMTLERPAGDPVDPAAVELCEHAAALIGPVLEVKRRDDRWLIVKAWISLVTLIRNLFGPRHVALKLSALTLAAVVAFFAVARGDYRVTADAILEGTVQRVIAAPIAGYVAEANVRAGDIVRAGDVMAQLDDRDLRLERLKWSSQRAQRIREFNEALAGHDRAQVTILTAQIQQAEAQVALIEEQLARMRIVAPFDGIVLAGDLSQALGAPVERGDDLFQVAPLNAYRIILKVDEREISQVEVGQTGQLVLSGMPDATLPFAVEKITPVSTAEEGRNYFRVEASLAEVSERVRPGMEGVGKVDIERRRLIWIWTHKILYWLRMFVWSWWP